MQDDRELSRWIDWGIRMMSVVFLAVPTFVILIQILVWGAIGASAGGAGTIAGVFLYIAGFLAVIVCVLCMAFIPQKVEDLIPGPLLLAQVLVRIPTYAIAMCGILLLGGWILGA